MNNSWTVKHLTFTTDTKAPDLPEGSELGLLTPDELEALPEGTVTYSIHGYKAVKGQDYIDDDTRFGFLAYGILKD